MRYRPVETSPPGRLRNQGPVETHCIVSHGAGGKGVSGRHGQAPLVRVDAECVAANICSPFLRAGNARCPPERVLTNALLAVYLPGLQRDDQRVVSTPSTNNPQSKIQNPQSPMRGVALKEHLLGGKVNEIRGGAKSVTTVSYFRGNDPSKWKSNISTCEVVDMGRRCMTVSA